MSSALPADPFPAALDMERPLDSLFGTPCPTTFDGETLWWDECEKARRYIAHHFEAEDWPEQVDRFRRERFIGGTRPDDGTPICIAGCYVLWGADLKRRRAEEDEEIEARKKAEPRRQVEEDETTAHIVRCHARRYGRRRGRAEIERRAERLTVRAIIGRARLAVGRLVGARHGGRERRVQRRRPTARAAARRGDPDPAGDPEPPKGRQP